MMFILLFNVYDSCKLSPEAFCYSYFDGLNLKSNIPLAWHKMLPYLSTAFSQSNRYLMIYTNILVSHKTGTLCLLSIF